MKKINGIYNTASHGGNLDPEIINAGITQKDITDFSTNINPLGFPPDTVNIINKNINKIKYYPDPESLNFKNAASEILNISPECIIAGNGCSELLYCACSLRRNSKILICQPSFSEYEKAAAASGSKTLFFNYIKKDSSFIIDIKKLSNKIPGSDILIIGNPNNPTGSFMQFDYIDYLACACRNSGCLLFIDEAFIDFIKCSSGSSYIEKAVKMKNVIVFRSLTKIFAIPGLRLGYAAGNKQLIKNMRNFQPDWPLNIFSQEAGSALVNNYEYINKSAEFINIEKEFMQSELSKIKGLKIYDSSVNFFLIEILDQRISSRELKIKLIKEFNILIRDCSSFRVLGKYFFRAAVKNRAENILLADALKTIIN